jgi:hypothetical protein
MESVKNMSSLLQPTLRRETGADISLYPLNAIERVEILRDGHLHNMDLMRLRVMNISLKKEH